MILTVNMLCSPSAYYCYVVNHTVFVPHIRLSETCSLLFACTNLFFFIREIWYVTYLEYLSSLHTSFSKCFLQNNCLTFFLTFYNAVFFILKILYC
jgi:hypothetical protein